MYWRKWFILIQKIRNFFLGAHLFCVVRPRPLQILWGSIITTVMKVSSQNSINCLGKFSFLYVLEEMVFFLSKSKEISFWGRPNSSRYVPGRCKFYGDK